MGTKHRILSFDQTEWMKPFVDFNTKMRKEAKTVVEQTTIKFTVDGTFGKTMECVRNRRNIQLVSNPTKVEKLIAKPQLKQFYIINDETVSIDRVRSKVTLDKPIHCGFAILELSKLHMYMFHYDVIKERYKSDDKLLFTDTDSDVSH